ncbi:carbamoyltransferase HypF [Roseibacterium beibuensis]|uniref:Carbamoyltransferase HypF n=1 Tax=[Roseibacterium] beibuensis TaxID=1193142 RepID=A0ABP9L011_9RHOB|nr:carbamoyltransferase HypF [Roseibacterium beibuensis]MCS6622004.1 carbamoyltransferase HypF [Roseibacterium beibuensis]
MKGRRIRVRGQVQGVGYRPFVWDLAHRLGVAGDVRNDAEGVLIHAWGGDLARFETALHTDAPPLADVQSVEGASHDFATAPDGFDIIASSAGSADTGVTPDAATCPDCLAEIRDPAQRRHRYAFTNCTHCGPRFTILDQLPYDRAHTSMAVFELCQDCRAEYEDPADRRFHAQPVACPACGPRLWLEMDGAEVTGDAIAEATHLLSAGAILAIKGLGGFHLACDATNGDAVNRLRDRKRRPGKPFALIGTPAMIRQHSDLTEAQEKRLQSSAAPIMLLQRTASDLPDSIAPGQDTLGWMVPPTPLHHLLLDAINTPLVMTSGNLSGQPQVIGNEEAREKLSAFCDGFLMHDRDILRRLDDSVERITPQGPMALRRARGRVPGTLPLPPGFEDAPQTLAFGGQLKSAICLTKSGRALLSHHLGDLDDRLCFDEFRKADADYAALFNHEPTLFACDLHPGYRASAHAARRAAGSRLVEVQHHHAHLAACLGENGWPRDGGRVAGIILDGLGLGDDGTIWGGELLVGDYAGFARVAHLAPAPLIGGDAAQRDPWRNLLARLDAAGLYDLADEMLRGPDLALARAAAARGINAPLSSSAGRLFDAFAAALGLVAGSQSFEGEAAMRLETLARRAPDGFGAPYPFDLCGNQIDPAPLFHAFAKDRADGIAPEVMAARFHAGLAQAFCGLARREVEAGRAAAVALSGGCFQNATLLSLCAEALADLPVLLHHETPANDGGLALGQALVAAAQA